MSGADHDVEASWFLVRGRYGDRLDEAQLADLRRIVEGLVGISRELRTVSLTNADAPLELATTWRAPRPVRAEHPGESRSASTPSTIAPAHEPDPPDQRRPAAGS